jgi:hypothetical protein
MGQLTLNSCHLQVGCHHLAAVVPKPMGSAAPVIGANFGKAMAGMKPPNSAIVASPMPPSLETNR